MKRFQERCERQTERSLKPKYITLATDSEW